MNDAIEQFNRTIDSWIGFIDEYTYEQLTRKPQPASWSLGQVYNHLISDTGYHIDQMRAALETDESTNEQMHPDAKAMFSNKSFPDLQIAGPGTDENTPQPADKEELKRKLVAIRSEVNDLYRSHNFLLSKGKSKHPGLDYFSALEWLTFTEMHLRHHLKQKARIDRFIQG